MKWELSKVRKRCSKGKMQGWLTRGEMRRISKGKLLIFCCILGSPLVRTVWGNFYSILVFVSVFCVHIYMCVWFTLNGTNCSLKSLNVFISALFIASSLLIDKVIRERLRLKNGLLSFVDVLSVCYIWIRSPVYLSLFSSSSSRIKNL